LLVGAVGVVHLQHKRDMHAYMMHDQAVHMLSVLALSAL
jgi:hypothetical protein